MKKGNIITIISVLLIIGGLVGSFFIEGDYGSRITNIVSMVTAVIGAAALFFQFKKDKEVNQASFVFEFSKEFRNSQGNSTLTNILEKYRLKKIDNINIEENYEDIVTYLQWLESLASLVKRKVARLDAIDDLLSYNFFIAVNNPEIQQSELIPCKEFYKGIYWIYSVWFKYKKKRKMPIILEEYGLEKSEGFNDFLREIKGKKKKKS